MKNKYKYKCTKCGLCCRNLDKNNIYNNLHDGDGLCTYLDIETNLCTIYEERPNLCNIDLSYELYFSNDIAIEDYYNLNYEGCRRLWKTREIRRKQK